MSRSVFSEISCPMGVPSGLTPEIQLALLMLVENCADGNALLQLSVGLLKFKRFGFSAEIHPASPVSVPHHRQCYPMAFAVFRITNIVILFRTVLPFSQRFTVAQLTFKSSASSFCEILRSLHAA